MLKKIKKEYKRFINREFKKLFGNYEPQSEPNIWSDIWKNYYAHNHQEIENKFDLLLRGVDDTSVRTARQVFERYVFLLPWQRHNDSFLYKKDAMFSEDELKGQQENYSVDKDRYRLPPEIYYETSVFKYGHGIKLVPEKVLKEISGRDFIDGGAFWGDSVIVLNDYTIGKIYSFEPDENNFEGLKKTIALNNLENKIIPKKLGLGDKSGNLELYNSAFCKTVLKTEERQKPINIETVTVDELAEKNSLDPGLIKLDVEGNELEAIQGAMNTIKNQRPVLLISIYHHPKDFFDIKPLIEREVPGYKFMIRKLNDFSPTYETMLIGWHED